MAEQSSRARFTGNQVLAFLDEDEDGMEDTFFPGSDDDLRVNSDSQGSDAGEEMWYWKVSNTCMNVNVCVSIMHAVKQNLLVMKWRYPYWAQT